MSSMTQKRRGLGRGLGALIVNTTPTEVQPPTAEESAVGILHCALAAISPNPQQPRAYFDENALNELATSIRTHGILQPLIVTANPEQPNHYWLIAGERRWRAAQLAGLTEAPVIVREASPQQLMEWALVENVQRADLNPIEEGAAYQTLIEEFGLTHAEVADRVGKSRSAVTNIVRLLQAPATVQKAVIDGTISAGHARALLALETVETIEATLVKVISEALNVRQTELLVKRLQAVAAAPAPTENLPVNPKGEMRAQLTYLEDRFRSRLGTRVNLNREANGSGRLVIHFYSDDDLNNIYRMIAGEDDDEASA